MPTGGVVRKMPLTKVSGVVCLPQHRKSIVGGKLCKRFCAESGFPERRQRFTSCYDRLRSIRPYHPQLGRFILAIDLINKLQFSDDVTILIPTMWVELTAISSVLALLNWHKPQAIFTLLVAIVLVTAFGGACFYASPFYAGGSYSGSRYPVVLTAIPLLLFLAILLRRCWRRSRNRA